MITYRIINGDCLAVLREMADNSIDMIFTDPPYGHNNNNNGDLISKRERVLGVGESKREDFRPIFNDGPEANDLFREALPEFKRILKPGCCCCCCCGGGGPDPQYSRWSLWMDEVFEFKQMIIWDKGPMGMGWHYRRSYETVLVGMKPGAACKWYDTSRAVENIIRPGDLECNKIIPSKDQHPTEKPAGLAGHFIRLHTTEGDTVLDPFMGSGSTGAAAISMLRNFIGIELDPHWADYSRSRLSRVAPLLAKEG